MYKRQGVFTFISGVQDEVHRFSIAYQRENQKKKAYASSLTAVPGVGPATAKALLAEFRTVAAVREAGVEELCRAKGVGRAAAAAIYDHFHPAAPIDKAP